jgi:hypothetical protein
VLYYMRTTPQEMILDLLDGFDVKVKSVFEELLGRTLSETQWTQAKLPVKASGAAIRGAVDGADAAYIASRMFTLTACHELDRSFCTGGRANASVHLGLGNAVQRINSKLPPEKHLGESLDRIKGQWGSLSFKIAHAEFSKMKDSASEWDRARLSGLTAAHAGAWLDGVPCQTLGTRLTSRMGRRLGLEICEERACPLCFQVMDSFGSHAESCMAGGDAVARHNETRDNVHRQAKLAGTRPELEKAKLLAGLGTQRDLGRRPADTLLHNAGGIRTARGRHMPRVALDIGVVNPQAPAHMQGASRATLGACTDYTQQKREKDNADQLCVQAGVDYQPIVWETFGGVAKEGEETLMSLNRMVAVNTNTPISEVAQRFWQRVSVDMQRANHRAFAKRGFRQELGHTSYAVQYLSRCCAAADDDV